MSKGPLGVGHAKTEKNPRKITRAGDIPDISREEGQNIETLCNWQCKSQYRATTSDSRGGDRRVQNALASVFDM